MNARLTSQLGACELGLCWLGYAPASESASYTGPHAAVVVGEVADVGAVTGDMIA